jgi:hypothetical protein
MHVTNASTVRVRAARAVAICADIIQVGLPYIFGEGLLSPFEAALDIAACLALTALVGWHIAFIPSFLIELLPIADLAPTWTIAAFIATRSAKSPPTPPSAPPTPQGPEGRPLIPASAVEQDQIPKEVSTSQPTGSSRTAFGDLQKAEKRH